MSPCAPGATLASLRDSKPLVHQITNYVVMNETANATLALGALPVTAHAREEVEEMVGLAKALVLNIGTLSSHWVEAMLLAGRAATERETDGRTATVVPLVSTPPDGIASGNFHAGLYRPGRGVAEGAADLGVVRNA